MNIKLWYIKSKNRMKFAHILWAIWSNLYQKLEKKFLGTNKSLLKNWITDTKNKTSDFIPMKAWNKYCNELGLKHYGSDPWYMGWDVISCPERIVVRKVVDCIPHYEKIVCKNGIKPISDITLDDDVLSYDFKHHKFVYNKVLNKIDTGNKTVYRVTYKNGQFSDFSKDHKILMGNSGGEYCEHKIEDLYKDRNDIIMVDRKLYGISSKYKVPVITELEYVEKDDEYLNEDLCFIIGYFLAEGWIQKIKSKKTGLYANSFPSFGGHDIPKYIEPLLIKNNIHYRIFYRKIDNLPSVSLLSGDKFSKILISLKTNSFIMDIPEYIKNLPKNKLQKILDGIFLGDGHLRKNNGVKIYNTSCDTLKDFIVEVSYKNNSPVNVLYQSSSMGAGKIPKPIWRLMDNKNSRFRNFYGYMGLSETTIKNIEKLNIETEMYDITVENDNNFIMASSGTIVHNCDDYSILAHSYFGDYINTGDSVFDFKGIFTMTWEDGSAHAISVWKNEYERNSYLVVSNDEMIKTRNISSLFKKKDIKMLWVANLSVTNGKIKFLKIDDNFWI